MIQILHQQRPRDTEIIYRPSAFKGIYPPEMMEVSAPEIEQASVIDYTSHFNLKTQKL